MANIDLDWEVDGIITPEESVTKMLKVIGEKDKDDSGTFWCWDGRVRSSSSDKRATDHAFSMVSMLLTLFSRSIPGKFKHLASAILCAALLYVGTLFGQHWSA